MIKNILKALETSGASIYKIRECNTDSIELFFIKKDLDMNRKKQVVHYEVTLYKDYEEDGQKYRGESTVKVHPNMNVEEMEELFRGGLYSAGFVKNKYYSLVENEKSHIIAIPSNFREGTLEEGALKIRDAIYGADEYDKGGINSCEIFLNKDTVRIINSKGVDISYEKYSSEVECITQWKDSQDVELFNVFKQGDLDGNSLSQRAKEAIEATLWREKAVEVPVTGKYRVILGAEAAKEVFYYYDNITNVSLIYQEISNVKVGDNIQGDQVVGDKITMLLEPKLPYDQDGVQLKETLLIEEGQVKAIHGSKRFAYYLGVEPTGKIRDVKVLPGSKTVEEMRAGDCVELVTFSGFQVDDMTGDFAGEIRLGFVWQNGIRTPITGGSISGNIKNFEKNMYLSKEIVEDDWYKGPAFIEIENVNIAGR